MRPHFPALFLILFFCFPTFTDACSYATQESSEQSENLLESDAHEEWTGLLSLLIPSHLTDKVQEASFTSNILRIVITAASKAVQPETQVPLATPNGKPKLLQRDFEALLLKETGNLVRSVETMINSSVALGMAFYEVLESASSDSLPSSYDPYTPLLKKVAKVVLTARDDFRSQFPLPATAPGHNARVKYVNETVEHIQEIVVRLASRYGKSEVVEGQFARVKPFFLDLGVLFGDVAELYPAAIEALVLNLSAVLLPEALFIRSLVILYCFGPYVLGKDAISGWLVRHVSESLRV